MDRANNTHRTDAHTTFKFMRDGALLAQQTGTNDLLKAAYEMLAQAERQIETKDRRIADLESVLTIDELTGLTNRRGFYEAFEREIDHTNRGNNEGGLLIMIDLDQFKTVNDTFGHLAGDEALRTVAAFLQGTIRNMDVAARLGGDEFIVLMPNTSIKKATKRAQKLRDDLNGLSFKWDGEMIDIRGSLGLQEYKTGDTIYTIIEQADKGMYRSKEGKKQTRH